MTPWYIWKLRWKLFWDFRSLEALYSLGSFRVKIDRLKWWSPSFVGDRWGYVNFIYPLKGQRIVRLLGPIDELVFQDVYPRALAQAREVLTGEQHLADADSNRRRNEKWERELEAREPMPFLETHSKAYVLDGNRASIRCGCGWLAPTVRAHLETNCSCNACVQAEREFQYHLEAKGAPRHA